MEGTIKLIFLVIVFSLHMLHHFVKGAFVIVLYEGSLSSNGSKLMVALR